MTYSGGGNGGGCKNCEALDKEMNRRDAVFFERQESRVAHITKLEAALRKVKDALYTTHRYFGAKDGTYACDVRLCEKSARYHNEQALAKIDEALK